MMQTCRACGSSRCKFQFLIGENKVVKCLDCTHVFLDVRHTADSIREMYEAYDAQGTEFYFEGIDAAVTRNFESYLRRCLEHVRSGPPPLRLLDVGCGAGAFLQVARKQGFDCEGAEICEPLANVTRQDVGCPVHTALLSQLEFSDDAFDVITMYDVIEHLADPVEDLKRVHRWLKPGGMLFLLTPNDRALLRRVARLAFNASFHLLQKPMRALYYTHHLSYFTVPSITAMVESIGFEVAAFETRNQEMSRLNISFAERLAVRTIFAVSHYFPSAGGKLVLWARKVPVVPAVGIPQPELPLDIFESKRIN